MPFFPVVCLLLIEFIDNNWIYWYWFGIFSLQLYFIIFFLSCFFSVCCCSYSLLWAFIHYIAMASSSKGPSFLPLNCVCSNPNLIRHGKRLLCLFLLRVFLSPTHSLSHFLALSLIRIGYRHLFAIEMRRHQFRLAFFFFARYRFIYEPRIPRNAATTESKASPNRPYVRYWATNSAQVNRHHDVDVESNASNYYVLLSAFDTRNKFWPTFRFRISRQVQLFQCQYLCSSSDSELNEADDILKAKY